MFPQPVMPVFVSWNTQQWMPVGLGSFRQHFPSWQMLVIDNNPSEGEANWNQSHEAERRWLQSQPGVIVRKNNGQVKTHGAAVDLAVEWCRQHGVEYLLHLEPDCLITGTQWYANLCRGMDAGAWMAGSHRKHYGPIHPTPSLWRVSRIRSSFDYANRLEDERHPRFLELFDRAWLIQAVSEAGQNPEFWKTTWDSGQRPWFECAVENKAFHAVEANDFVHFWFGSDKYFTAQQFSVRPELESFTNRTHVEYCSELTGSGVSDTAASLGNILIQKLRDSGAKKVIYAGCPRHANSGDLLLFSGLHSAICEAGLEIVQLLPWPEMPSLSNDADTILLHGGGNFGDLYPHEMQFRMNICRTIKDRRIIWLPQSMEYQCGARAQADLQEIASFPHVEIWLRDAISLARATAYGLNNVVLVPDGAFGLRSTPAAYNGAGARIEIRRSDGESSNPAAASSDWMLPGATMIHRPSEAWDMARRRFKDVRMVVSDRLHVHLLCVLSDIPNVLVADRYGKNRGMFQTFTHLHRRSRFVAQWDLAAHAEQELTTAMSTAMTTGSMP